MSDKIKYLENQKRVSDNRADQLKITNDSSLEKIKQLEAKCALLQLTNQQITEGNHKLVEDVHKLTEHIQQLTRENQTIADANKQLDQDHKLLTRDYQLLIETNQKLNDEYQQLQAQYQVILHQKSFESKSNHSSTVTINNVDLSSLEAPNEEKFSVELENLTNRLFAQLLDNNARIRYSVKHDDTTLDPNTIQLLAKLDQFLHRECYFRPSLRLSQTELWKYASCHFTQLREEEFYHLMGYRVDNIKISYYHEDEQSYYIGMSFLDEYKLINPELTAIIYNATSNQHMIEIIRDFIAGNSVFNMTSNLKFREFLKSFENWYCRRYQLRNIDRRFYTYKHFFNIFMAMSNEFPYEVEDGHTKIIRGITLLSV